ncbi:MAG TPA: hypothetical protein VFX58_13925 [Chitinophagaceae bacterium]|nr:hypothetical protein [Chitinophagaceae bacterium]
MQKRIILALLLVAGTTVSAQIKSDSTKSIKMVSRPVSTGIQSIPPARAARIRKDVAILKNHLATMQDSVTVLKKETDRLMESMKADPDSISEMGETESLRLQLAMDRLSNMMSTLSNILKKISDTQKSITQNLK